MSATTLSPIDTGRGNDDAPATPGRLPILERLGHFTHRRRWRVITLWILLLVALSMTLSPVFSDRTVAEKRGISGSDAATADSVLAERFSSVVDEYDLLVFTSKTSSVDDPEFQATVETAIALVQEQEGVVSVQSPLDPSASDQVSVDGRSALALVSVAGDTDAREVLADATAERLAEAGFSDPTVVFTGESPVNTAVAEQSDNDLAAAEMIGLPLALLVLLIAFGSFRAAALPIVLALVGVGVTFGVLGLVSFAHPFVALTENITTLIGLGIGIDFAMFIVARYRESIVEGDSSADALAHALSTSGRSVFFSAVTVIISMTGLFLIDNGIFWDLAMGAIVTTAVMAVAALTLLPAMIAVAGPALARGRRARPPVATADARTGWWGRWAHAVMRRPARFAAIGIMAVLVMAAPAVDLRLGLDSGADAISQAPAGRGLEVLTEKFSEGALSPTQVVVRTTGPAFSSAQLASVDALTDSIVDTPGVASATSITTIAAQIGVDLRADGLDPLLQRTHSDEFATLVNADNGANATTISVIPDAAIDSENAREIVETIRHDLADDARDVGLAVNVTGPTAHINDLAEEITNKLPWVLAYVLTMSFLLLTAVFRSPLLSLKALFMNLLSVGAAYGVLVWVFQWGNGGSLLGFESTGTIQAYLPILAFAILFGISMDYEVFLLGRIREEWLRTGDNTAAVADGLAHTARPITSAAAIQCVVFGAFVFTRVIDVKQVGFALAAAIVIDATLIRVVLVPATMRLMGRWNWWTPRWLDRLASMTSATPPTPVPVGTLA